MTAKRRAARGQSKIWFNTAKGRWIGDFYQVRADGTRKRCQITGTDQVTVETALKNKRFEMELAARTGDVPLDNRLTVGTLFDRWITAGCPSTDKRQATPTTVAYNGRIISTCLGDLRAVAVKDLDSWAVAKVLQSLADAGRGTSTLTRCKSIIDRAMWYAANGPKSQKVTVPQDARTAGKDAKVPQNVAKPRTRKALSEAEVALMLAKLDGHAYQAPVALIAATGLRPSEALGLRHGDYDVATSMLTIARTVVERDGRWIAVDHVKSDASARKIPLSTKAAAVLEAQLASHPGLPSAPIFPGRHGTTWLSVRDFSHDVSRHTGRQVYDLRHTLASRLNDQGWPIAKAAAYLGHIPETYIRVYLHSMPTDNATALDDVRAALG